MRLDSGTELSLMDVLVTIGVSGCAYFGFVHNNVYSVIIAFLNRNSWGFGPFELVIPAAYFALVLVSCAFVRGSTLVRIHTLFLILLLPSIFFFSNVDWPSLVGAAGGLAFFRTDLSFVVVLALGLAVVSGRMLVSFSSRIRQTKEEFLDRGAPQDDIEVVAGKELVFSSGVLLLSVGAVFGIGIVAFLLGAVLYSSIGFLGYPHVIFALVATTVLAICLFLYLKGQAKLETKETPV